MRISEDELSSFSKFRDVSDLRTQFQCEYRLYLKQKYGDIRTKASIEGELLHSIFEQENEIQQSHNRMIPAIIIILTIIVSLIWILW